MQRHVVELQLKRSWSFHLGPGHSSEHRQPPRRCLVRTRHDREFQPLKLAWRLDGPCEIPQVCWVRWENHSPLRGFLPLMSFVPHSFQASIPFVDPTSYPYCGWFRNPANQVEVGSLSHYLQGYIKSQVVFSPDFWTINSTHPRHRDLSSDPWGPFCTRTTEFLDSRSMSWSLTRST